MIWASFPRSVTGNTGSSGSVSWASRSPDTGPGISTTSRTTWVTGTRSQVGEPEVQALARWEMFGRVGHILGL